jgi:hypothetical protein
MDEQRLAHSHSSLHEPPCRSRRLLPYHPGVEEARSYCQEEPEKVERQAR